MIAKVIACTSTATSTLDYLHHDKGGAITAERVAWAENVNCIQASAEETERMWAQLVDDAPEIKRQAGGSTRGRRLENPYAHYVLSWPPDENPSRDEMMTATGDAMDRLGYKGCQRRVVAHSDTDHKHAHVIVCRVHSETGRAMGRKNDGDRLREWSLEYEKAQGQIRVPGRLDDLTNRARYMRQKREQPDKKPPRATDAEKKRRRERRHRRARTRDAIGRPTNPTDSERQEWAALFQSQPTSSEKADLKKAQTERRIKAERSERAVAATPPMMKMRPAPTLHREDARVGLDVRPTPPTMEMRPPPKERPAVAQVPRPDQDLAASPTPAPQTRAAPQPAAIRDQAADRETKQIAAAAAAEATRRAETRFEHVKTHAMGNAEHAAAELAHDRRRAPPTMALCLAAQEHVAGGRYTATQEVAGVPLAVGRLRRDLELEILDILADPEPRGARIPPPEPEAVASLVQTVQDLADRRIHNAAVEEGLHLPRTEREVETAAPADEQPAPPVSDTPQHEQSAAAANPYDSEIAPVRGSEAGPGGVDETVQKDRKNRETGSEMGHKFRPQG